MFFLLWLGIGFLSIFDLYLNLRFPVVIDCEFNPVAQQLLIAVRSDLAAFGAIKMVGTQVALGLLWALREYRGRLATGVAGVVFLFYLGVLGWMFI